MILFGLFGLLALLAPTTELLAGGEGQFNSKELNFEIEIPEDLVDWEAVEIDNKKYPTLRVHYITPFADSDAYADLRIYVQKMPKSMVRMKLEKLAKKWKGSIEGNLSNPRERTDGIEKFAGVDAYKADVQGDMLKGNHRVTWMVFKNGQFLYTVSIMRAYAAVKDEDVEEEIGIILKAFKFGEIRKVKAGKGVKKGGDAPPDAGGPGGKGGDEPEELTPEQKEKRKKKKIESSFWRFECVKPEGLEQMELTDNLKANQIKFDFRGVRNTVAMGIRIYVWSLKSKKYTLDKLVERKQKWWKTRVKKSLDPKLDKNYAKKFPLAKKAYRMELVGRSTRRERWIYLLAECENDRQYQIEIYTMGDAGDKEWGKAVEQFIKSWKTIKK
jgi:hypothetical protein